jgi:hypothetical protein
MKIQFRITFGSSDNKINGIKLIRLATQCGLKESKDFVDRAYNGTFYALANNVHPDLLIMNDAQFGRLCALLRTTEFEEIFITEVQILKEISVTDFSEVVPR